MKSKHKLEKAKARTKRLKVRKNVFKNNFPQKMSFGHATDTLLDKKKNPAPLHIPYSNKTF